MSGHSKWATIKHKKGALDAKRGKIFTKLTREITAAARMGGGDASSNPRLRTAIQSAREQNMPGENIDRAVKKGTGDLEGVSYEEITYEGYGPQGVAMLVQVLTDNKNRTAPEIRMIFAKYGGAMGSAGSVAWIFEKKGLIVVDQSKSSEEVLMEAVLSAGAEDLTSHGEKFEIITSMQSFEAVRQALEKAKITVESGQLTMIPKNMAPVSVEGARTILKLIDSLEDQDDVQNVYANCDIPDEVLAENE
ncbi:MAG: YebC/PmpR family DNA-binding transcriptional regulator [Candidatus Omnitrophica bacterium]|nr:YebC/PmpR family DNA-binding transcriptional regulator [Candidatus Omnitrophota bacterium]